jgi:hypothetical protein
VAEGARLLSVCAGNCTEGSNPSLSAPILFCRNSFLQIHRPEETGPEINAPIAQLDRAVVYETTGQRFESSWAH